MYSMCDIQYGIIAGLLEKFEDFCWAARKLGPYLHELEKSHLKQFHLTWEVFNKHVYLGCVYIDPKIQGKLLQYIAQVKVRK